MRRSTVVLAGLAAALVSLAPAAWAWQPLNAQNLIGGVGGSPLASPVPRQTVSYDGPYSPGTIIISTKERRL
jgi:hypothetical protein